MLLAVLSELDRAEKLARQLLVLMLSLDHRLVSRPVITLLSTNLLKAPVLAQAPSRQAVLPQGLSSYKRLLQLVNT